MTKYFRIVDPSKTCAGPKAGVGFIRNYVPKLKIRLARGLTGRDASVDIAGFGLWVLNEKEYELISEKEYFLGALRNEFKRFRNYE